uniref:Uncharacterized protein n=1 Tax=Strigamia maritima TaxID=126957 RepID=T1J9B4_STRMM
MTLTLSDFKWRFFLLVSSEHDPYHDNCGWNATLHLCWTLVVLRPSQPPMPGRTHESQHRSGKPSEYTVEEVALFNLTLYADYVWSESALDVHREACQKTWVKFNRIREACQKTSILDLLAEIRVDHKKTVRDTIPFSHLAQYGNYEYNDVIERGFVNETVVETPLAFDVTWKHNSSLNSLSSESIVQNQLIREANEKADGIDYEQQLEYTECFRKDPSLGRAQEPALGEFGRVCGSFDPIKFNCLVRQVLKSDTSPKETQCKDKCVSWTNWLLCVYPEFLQSLCSRDDFANMMIPDIEMSIDFLEILDKPVSAFDIHQFPKPKLRSWNRCRQGVRRLFQQITSQEVQRLWLVDDYLLDNRVRLGLSTSEEDTGRHVDSSCHKTNRERMRRSNWIKKSPHLHRREDMRHNRKNIHHIESDKYKDKDKLDHQTVIGLQTSAAAARTPSAPSLTELNFEDFPTLSEAATMNFRQPAAVSGTSRIRSQGERGKKSSPYDCHVEWGIFVGTPLQRNIHSRSDTDLQRYKKSASQGSNSMSSPISDSSMGLRSESDSDIQLQESFRRRENDAHGLLRIADDGRMNIHAPSFCPRIRLTSTQASPRQGPQTPTGVPPVSGSANTSDTKDNYLMQQFPCPLGFPNQLFPRYVVPPPVRLPSPGQFISPQTNDMWRFPQPPPPMGPQSPFVSYGGLFPTQFPGMPSLGACPTSGISFSEGVQQQFHPLAWFQPQSRGYKTFIPQPQSGYSQENTGRGEEREFRCAPLWRRGEVGVGQVDPVGNMSSGSDEGRKARSRKRDPINLVHLANNEVSQARRNRRPRCRLGRGVLPTHGGSGETPSEESEQSATQNDESSEEWPPPESEDFSDVPEAMSLELPSVDIQPIETFTESKSINLRQRSLNTSESSRSSEQEDIGSPGTTSMDSARMPQNMYISYKLSVESDARSEVPPLRLGPSGSYPSSPDKDASVLEEALAGTTCPSSPMSPPALMTPPARSYVATPTLCSPSSCEPEALETALLQHLVKWSAAKMATEAEDSRGDKFSFRWIPEDDLERQAAEEYCPSKENSHEKIGEWVVHWASRSI